MFKLGDAYFDEEFRFGIAPVCRDKGGHEYIVSMQSGDKISLTVSDGEIAKTLTDAGLITEAHTLEESQFDYFLTINQCLELKRFYDSGFRWIAKDVRGARAFTSFPSKLDGVYWLPSLCIPGDRGEKLEEEYSFLTEDDPIAILGYRQRILRKS